MAFLNETGLEQVWGKIKTKVSSIENTISDINKAKVDKISGKGLSTNDFTTDEKNKLAGIATGATKVIVDSALSNTSTNAIQNKVVANMKTNIDDELSNKPSKTGDGASGTWGISITGNASTATKATQDGNGNVITSKYATLNTSQTITGAKTFSSEVMMDKGYYVRSFPGTAGTLGYVKIATLTIKGNYQNAPISFKFIQRGILIPSIIFIAFQNIDNRDPALRSFTGYGLNIEYAYLHKSNTSTWDLYIQKTEGYDIITIIDFNNSYNTNISIDWVGNTQVSTLPAGGITCSFGGTIGGATKLATARTLTIGNTGKTFDGSGNVSWSLTEIGAAASSHTHSYLPLSGGAINGVFRVRHSTNHPYLMLESSSYNDYQSEIYYSIPYSSATANFGFREYSRSSSNHTLLSYYEEFELPSVTSDMTSNSTYRILTSKFKVSVAQGGTGAATKSGARSNLGITSGTSLPSASGYSAGDIFILY